MARIEISLKPRFNSGGGVSGWEVTDGKSVAVNTSHKDGEKVWAKSVREYQAAGYTVEAKAYEADGKSLAAHGTYYPSGSVTDHGPKPAAPARSAAMAGPKKSEALPRKQRSISDDAFDKKYGGVVQNRNGDTVEIAETDSKALKAAEADRTLWTHIEGDNEKTFLVPGFARVNRIAHYRSVRPWSEDDRSTIIVRWTSGTDALRALPAPSKPSKKPKAKAEALPAKKGKGKGKSAYTDFVKRRLPELHAAGYANKDAMTAVGAEWQKLKK